MTAVRKHNGIWIAGIIWLICIAAALFAAGLRSADIPSLLPYAGLAAVPAVTGLILSPLLHREWARIIVVFSWIALAILAVLAIGFVPMVVLFLCAPAIAAQFEKEKVIEAMVIAAIAAAGLFYFIRSGGAPAGPLVGSDAAVWGINTAMASTVGLLISALYSVASAKPIVTETTNSDLLDAVPGGLVRVDSNDKISAASAVAVAQLGLPTADDEIFTDSIFKDADKREELKSIIQKSRLTNRKVSRRFHLSAPDGGVRSAEITSAPMENGEVLLHVYDSTAHEARLKTLHTAYASAQKDADGKALFFAGVSHELRTPLNAIIGFSDMMRSRLFGPLPNKYAEYADLIHDSGQHMLDLIGDVLDLSKIDAGKYELTYHSFDAADVIRSSVKMLRPAADSAEIRLDVEIINPDGELLVEADRKALRQIILNLLSNAIKFTPKGGRVLIRGDIENDKLRLGVVDNGAGMTERELNSVGEPYVQTESGKASEARGSGLGLSLVKSMAELHGGVFEISSQKGVGTTAEVIVPVSRG